MYKKRQKVDPNSMGGRIRAARKSYKITPDELAERLGISLSHMRLIELNDRLPSFALMIRLCETLNISPNYMIYGNENENLSDIRKFGYLADTIITRYDFSGAEQEILLDCLTNFAGLIYRLRS